MLNSIRHFCLVLCVLLAAFSLAFAQAPGPGPDNGSATAPNRRLINEPGSCQIGETYYNMTTNVAKVCTVAGVFQAFGHGGNLSQPALLPFTAFSTPAIPHDIVAPASTQEGATGTTYWSEIFIGTNATLTGACWLNGGTAATTNYKQVVLWNALGGVVANGITAGVIDGGLSIYTCAAFTATVNVTGPAPYFIGFIVNGSTDYFYTYTTGSTPAKYITGSVAGTFGAPVAIVPGASFTTAVGPLMYVY